MPQVTAARPLSRGTEAEHVTEENEHDAEEPTIADVPEPDQEPHEPITDEADEEEEAAAEEAETPAEEPAEASVDQGAQQEEWEERFKKAERAFKTYTNAIGKAWEDDALHLVPFPIDPGAPMGFIDSRNVGRVDDETRQNLLAFLGLSGETEYPPDPYAKVCDTCDGNGRTGLPSKVPGEDSRTCPTCDGAGWLATGTVPTNGHVERVPVSTPAGTQLGPLVTSDRDDWGEPKTLPDGRRNPNYGKMPSFKVPVEPYGVTAHLGETQAIGGV